MACAEVLPVQHQLAVAVPLRLHVVLSMLLLDV